MKQTLLVAALLAVALSACGKKEEVAADAASAVVEAASAVEATAASAVDAVASERCSSSF
ncbi:hypothetical protein [Deefgea sp. CFH1-16]|uniref:hypothetical protein n=1 Tax=Deefgea sp. CFH1-16 TaxID=2675457 RepID=UPI001E16E3F3|nr:hypothetical protein [Deefgea sp. CFH1-16]MBM5575298.1 hypothetical protein [Deefgea sp. CFH1-16]